MQFFKTGAFFYKAEYLISYMKRYMNYLPALLLTVLVSACSDDQPTVKPEPDPIVPEEPAPEPEEEIKTALLEGEIIGSQWSVDYNNNNAKTDKVNTKANVFDGDFNTFFASYDRSGTWVGLDLGEKHIIHKIGYSPRITQKARVQLAVIEGANEADFSDAMPIHLIKEEGVENEMSYADIHCSKGFRYVRYVSPNNVRCNLAELEFYGYPGNGDDAQL